MSYIVMLSLEGEFIHHVNTAYSYHFLKVLILSEALKGETNMLVLFHSNWSLVFSRLLTLL